MPLPTFFLQRAAAACSVQAGFYHILVSPFLFEVLACHVPCLVLPLPRKKGAPGDGQRQSSESRVGDRKRRADSPRQPLDTLWHDFHPWQHRGSPWAATSDQAPGDLTSAMLERLSRLRSRRRSAAARISPATAVRRACSAASRARSGPGGAARALSARPAASASGWQNIVVGTPARWAATLLRSEG